MRSASLLGSLTLRRLRAGVAVIAGTVVVTSWVVVVVASAVASSIAAVASIRIWALSSKVAFFIAFVAIARSSSWSIASSVLLGTSVSRPCEVHLHPFALDVAAVHVLDGILSTVHLREGHESKGESILWLDVDVSDFPELGEDVLQVVVLDVDRQSTDVHLWFLHWLVRHKSIIVIQIDSI